MRSDPYQERARALAVEAGLDPDAKIDRPGQRPMPTWCLFRDAARKEKLARDTEAVAADIALKPQAAQYHNSPLKIFGKHDDESPMAYRRLPEVLAEHARSIKVQHTLRPFAVAMAGENEFDPFKD